MLIDNVIRQASRNTKTELTLFTNGDSFKGAYNSDAAAVTLKNMLIGFINDIIKKLCIDKKLLITSEDTVGIDINGFGNNFLAIRDIKDPHGFKISWELQPDGSIKVDNYHLKELKTVEYYYIPEDITSEKDDVPIKEYMVNPLAYSDYAAFMYFQTNKKYDKAQYWLALYGEKELGIKNDKGFNNHVGQGW